jgi:hypothetical protein
VTALKKQQTILTPSQDGEIHLTLSCLGHEEKFGNLKSVQKEEAKKIAKKEADQPLLLRRV